jgi:hypothetical protein
MKKTTTYSEKLKDPRWQKKRLEILQRDLFSCQSCCDDKSTLHVHHRIYFDGDPWDTPDDFLVTLCESCHQRETDNIQQAITALSKAVKTHFLVPEIEQLASAITDMKVVHCPDVVISAIAHWITDVDKMRQVVDQYFEYLRQKSKHEITDDLPF